VVLALLQPQLSIAQGGIRIAQFEPLSGPFRAQGEANVRTSRPAPFPTENSASLKLE
jgi:hypothetical protein